MTTLLNIYILVLIKLFDFLAVTKQNKKMLGLIELLAILLELLFWNYYFGTTDLFFNRALKSSSPESSPASKLL